GSARQGDPRRTGRRADMAPGRDERTGHLGARQGETAMLFPTTLVGSYPQPEWLIDRERLAARFPPRVRARELWRVPEAFLAQAQDDATIMAIKAQEDAGLDIITDGEIRRESYSNRFATALDGIDLDNPGTALDRSGHPNPVPRVVAPIRRRHAVGGRDRRKPARSACARSTARLRASPASRPCISASATRPSFTCARRDTRFFRSLRSAAAGRSRSRPRNPGSTARC